MTDPIKPISKAAKVTSVGSGENLPENIPEQVQTIPSKIRPDFQIQASDIYIKDQSSSFVGPDTFVSGDEVLSASLAFFAPESAVKEKDELSPAEKTNQMSHLDYLLGISSHRVVSKTESNSAELFRHREELALYASYAAGQAQLKEKKKKKLWKRISGFLKSIFIKD